MRMLLGEYGTELELMEGVPVCLSIETPILYRNIVGDIWRQANGGDGGIVLFDGDKTLSLSKDAELIPNPFDINLNSKKLLSKLYQEINRIALEDFSEVSDNINMQIVNYLDEITRRIPYPLDYEVELDISALAKIYKVCFEDDSDGVLSRLLSYIKLLHSVCGTECFILCNIKQYMTEDELILLYRDLVYEHVCILDIEGRFSYKLQEETCVIIDEDECLITID